jgi:hypothetical protein
MSCIEIMDRVEEVSSPVGTEEDQNIRSQMRLDRGIRDR